ncbi:hypothetical protein Patl1_11833 [Pistacia atlantica]|uniref:Uncharacterized protein n=1 Tax=Pistacia atlantica TaxID=434234 RepID=A0ACC1A366_9ROSI|nr:hypothetical protein Patl1_11833 [Pistacia atlantica]
MFLQRWLKCKKLVGLRLKGNSTQTSSPQELCTSLHLWSSLTNMHLDGRI